MIANVIISSSLFVKELCNPLEALKGDLALDKFVPDESLKCMSNVRMTSHYDIHELAINLGTRAAITLLKRGKFVTLDLSLDADSSPSHLHTSPLLSAHKYAFIACS